ncbi:TPA: hypothetical protein I7183_07075 [Vibrio vulnificus]|nr:hypothetical protein [Vibrio vulnificus]
MQQVVWFGVTPLLPLLLLDCSMLPIAVSAFSNAASARVDEWFPVCTGMTAGGVAAMC